MAEKHSTVRSNDAQQQVVKTFAKDNLWHVLVTELVLPHDRLAADARHTRSVAADRAPADRQQHSHARPRRKRPVDGPRDPRRWRALSWGGCKADAKSGIAYRGTHAPRRWSGGRKRRANERAGPARRNLPVWGRFWAEAPSRRQGSQDMTLAHCNMAKIDSPFRKTVYHSGSFPLKHNYFSFGRTSAFSGYHHCSRSAFCCEHRATTISV